MNKLSSFLRRAENSGRKADILQADIIKVENNSSEYSIRPDSLLGYMLYNTGGAVFDSRVRLYGSGKLDITLRNLKWGSDGRFLIGEDIWGGLFALAIDKTVIYFAPDCLE